MSELSQTVTSQINKIQEDCAKIEPLVCIRCITFNHEPYIRDALEGFVMQKTDFPFVAIVHDDASTDETARIIREYAERYPDIIKPIFESENQYSKKDGSLTRIMDTACEATGAKYMAICEGDDYWTDPLKLQKQVDFLESHPEYSMCFHSVDIKDEGDVKFSEKPFQHLKHKEYTGWEIMDEWTVPTCSTLLRSEIVYKKPNNKNFTYGDNVLWLTCACLGKIMCLNDKMAVYRRQPSGFTSDDSVKLGYKYTKHLVGLLECFKEPTLSDVLIRKFNESLFIWILNDTKKNLIPIYSLKFAMENLRYLKLKKIYGAFRIWMNNKSKE